MGNLIHNFNGQFNGVARKMFQIIKFVSGDGFGWGTESFSLENRQRSNYLCNKTPIATIVLKILYTALRSHTLQLQESQFIDFSALLGTSN